MIRSLTVSICDVSRADDFAELGTSVDMTTDVHGTRAQPRPAQALPQMMTLIALFCVEQPVDDDLGFCAPQSGEVHSNQSAELGLAVQQPITCGCVRCPA